MGDNNGDRKLEKCIQNNEIGPLFQTRITKFYSKSTEDFNRRTDTIKQKVGKKLIYVGLGSYILATKSTKNKKQNQQIGLSRVKRFCTARKLIK